MLIHNEKEQEEKEKQREERAAPAIRSHSSICSWFGERRMTALDEKLWRLYGDFAAVTSFLTHVPSPGMFFFWVCCVMQSYSFKCHFLCPNFPTFLIIFFTEKLSHCLWGLFIPPAALNSDWNVFSRFLQFPFHLYDFIAFQNSHHKLSVSSPFCSVLLLLKDKLEKLE